MFREQSPQLAQTFLFHANVCRRRGRFPLRFADLSPAAPRRPARAWRTPAPNAASGAGAERIVCVSQAVADFYRDRARFPPERLIVIPNGVDVEKLNRLAAGCTR